MAGSLLGLLSNLTVALDDIATMGKVAAVKSIAMSSADDMATMGKTAAGKTTGIIVDDLAVNADQVNGVNQHLGRANKIKQASRLGEKLPNREWPIIGKVAIGSLKNKAIILPGLLVLNAAAAPVIPLLLMAGGAYLCYEGSEKIIETVQEKILKKGHHSEQKESGIKEGATADQILQFENEKIKGAVRTDFVLSGEIMTIALGTAGIVAAPVLTQIILLGSIGVGMTALVYGTVAGIVKIDDVGIWMKEKESAIAKSVGDKLVKSMPYVMRGLTFAGTTFMLVVGGQLVAHGLPEAVSHLAQGMGTLSGGAVDLGMGLVAGLGVVGVVNVVEKPFKFISEKIKSLFHKKKMVQENVSDVSRTRKPKPSENEVTHDKSNKSKIQTKPRPSPRPFARHYKSGTGVSSALYKVEGTVGQFKLVSEIPSSTNVEHPSIVTDAVIAPVDPMSVAPQARKISNGKIK